MTRWLGRGDRPLLKQMRLQVAALAAHAERKGEVSEAALTAAERLLRVARLERALFEHRGRAALIGILVALGVATLLLVKVSRTNVALQVAVSSLEFKPAQPITLLSATDAVAIRVGGLAWADIPGCDGVRLAPIQPPDGRALTVALATRRVKDVGGDLSLPELTIATGATLRVSADGQHLRVHIQPGAGTQPLRLSAWGPLHWSVSGVADCDVQWETARAIELNPGGGDLDIQITSRETSSVRFTANVPVRALRFSDVEEPLDRSGTAARAVSSILEGTLVLTDLGPDPQAFRRSQRLHLAFDGPGALEGLTLAGGSLSVSCVGRVSELRTGFGAAHHDLMPSRVEWLAAQRPLWLLWGAGLAGFTVLSALVNWFMRRDL